MWKTIVIFFLFHFWFSAVTCFADEKDEGICVRVEFGPGKGFEDVFIPLPNKVVSTQHLEERAKNQCSRNEQCFGEEERLGETFNRRDLMHIYNLTAKAQLVKRLRLETDPIHYDQMFYHSWMVVLETIVNQVEYALVHRQEIRNLFTKSGKNTISCVIVSVDCHSKISFSTESKCVQFGLGLADKYDPFDLEYLFGKSRLDHITVISEMPININRMFSIQRAIFNILKPGGSFQSNIQLQISPETNFILYNSQTLLKPFSNLTFALDHSGKLARTYVINLSSRPHKWNQFTESAETNLQLDGEYIHFNAIDGTFPSSAHFPWIQAFYEMFGPLMDTNDVNHLHLNPHGVHALRRGVIGCALSHLQIFLETAKDSRLKDSDYVLVLEDDAVFEKPSATFNWKKLRDTLNNDPRWDFLFLGHSDIETSELLYDDSPIHMFSRVKKMANIRRSYGAGMYAYCIRKRAAAKLRSILSKAYLTQPLDWFVFDAIAQGNLTAYKVFPPIVTTPTPQQSASSDTFSNFPYNKIFRMRECKLERNNIDELSLYRPTYLSISNPMNGSYVYTDIKLALDIQLQAGVDVNEFYKRHKCTKICAQVSSTVDFKQVKPTCVFLDEDLWLGFAAFLHHKHAHVKIWLETINSKAFALGNGMEASAGALVYILPPVELEVMYSDEVLFVNVRYVREFVLTHSTFSICFNKLKESMEDREIIYGCDSMTRVIRGNEPDFEFSYLPSKKDKNMVLDIPSISVYAVDTKETMISYTKTHRFSENKKLIGGIRVIYKFIEI